MKIVIAPDSFKECLSAKEVAGAIATGWKTVLPETDIVKLPMADGGEGTLTAMIDATDGEYHSLTVSGPLGTPIEARFGLLGNSSTAVIEMAEASGLEKVPQEHRNPLTATSYGTGELIRAALDKGVKEIIVTLGGSATNDGGTGMMAALGVRFLNSRGQDIGYVIKDFHQLAAIDVSQMDPRLKSTQFVTACDVDNPLVGASGASAVFGPQKGANTDMVRTLDQRLTQYADVLENTLQKKVRHLPGTGAAGGMAAALVAFMDSTLKPGIEIVIEAAGLKGHLHDADLVITGEGRIDSQTLNGKTPVGVARCAKSFNLPVIALGGSVSNELGLLREAGIDVAISVISSPCTLDEALKLGEANLRQMGEVLAALYRVSSQKNFPAS